MYICLFLGILGIDGIQASGLGLLLGLFIPLLLHFVSGGSTMTRVEIQSVYIRVCQDSNFGLDAIAAAQIAAGAAKLSPLEIWVAVGSLDAMDRIARGEHPAAKRNAQ
jgi:hypothetical protein